MNIERYENNSWCCANRDPASEFLVSISVNSEELVTLTSSPHKLNELVVGFLNSQGIISDMDDIITLGVCPDSGRAEIQIKEFRRPTAPIVLTSGCGSGISFDRPSSVARKSRKTGSQTPVFAPETVTSLMQQLNTRTEKYHQHGGIHSAAVGDNDQLLLFAEDIGRHNTLDRLAGEALMRGLSLDGKVLVTSGRISSEMVSKAAFLGIEVIASRTSPTDLAVKMCSELGITLIGYVRKTSFDVYCCSEKLSRAQAD